jgi:hypothetical protein
MSEFDDQWHRLLAIVGSIYLVLALGLFAATLRVESNNA